MKRLIAVFYVRTSNGFPLVVWLHHNPHPQGWGFLFSKAASLPL